MKQIRSTLFFLLLLALSACTQSEVIGGDTPEGKKVEARFHLNILSATIPQTRSLTFTPRGTVEADTLSAPPTETKSSTDPGDAADKNLMNLWAGQYNAAGNLITQEYFPTLATQESVNLPLQYIPGTCHVWVVANSGDLTGKADTEEALKQLTTNNAFTADGLPANTVCPMTGVWSGEITENVRADITLKRSLAKIKFVYSVGGTGFTFTPTSLELCNVPKTMKYTEEETPTQLTGEESYHTYALTSPGSSGAQYWYLPENPAGTGSNTGGLAIEKTGDGVSHATCIRLSGDATQDGVAYSGVVFSLYPGAGTNDYTIYRNGLYTIEVTLTGIDFSDKRVTVETVPEMQNPDNLDPEKGATSVFQVTTRPGVPWSFTIPGWLSAVVGDKTYESGYKLDFIGPYKVQFKAVTANPRAEARETRFTVGEKEIKVVQNASSLTVGSPISLPAEKSLRGSSSTFTATKGLPWSAFPGAEWDDWLGWEEGTSSSGSETTGAAETLTVKALKSNPSASIRTGSILVKAGEAASSSYTGLTASIAVTQAGAIATASTSPIEIAAGSVQNLSATFSATSGLDWIATTPDGWLTLLNTTGATTGSPQTIPFNAALNLSSADREGTLSVRVGNAANDPHPGPVAEIKVSQKGSVFSVEPTTLELKPATNSSGSVTVTATEGLPWTVSAGVGDAAITTTTQSGNGSGTILFSAATENTSATRSSTFTLTVTGTNNPVRSQAVQVTQMASVATVTIDKTVLEAYIKKTGNELKNRPPFNCDGGKVESGNLGTDKNKTLVEGGGSYSVEIQSGQNESLMNYSSAITYCDNLVENNKTKWRIPTLMELYAINTNKERIEAMGGVTEFTSDYYWTCSVYSTYAYDRSILNFADGNFGVRNTTYEGYVRCVRDISSTPKP